MSTITLSQPEQTSSAPETVRGGFRALAGLLWRRRWTVVLVFAIVANAIAAGLILADREYTAAARIAASPVQDELAPTPASYEDLLGTIADIAESRPVLEQVAEQIEGRSVDELRDDVESEVVPGTVIIQVSVTDTEAALAAEIANLIVAALPTHDPGTAAFDYHVTEHAVVPDEFTSPNIPVAVLAGAVLALLLACLAAVVADRVFRTVSEPEEMGEVSETAVLGVIPKPTDPEGMPAIDFWSEEFQAIRALRIAIEFASAEDPTRLLVVTSAAGSDSNAGWTEVNLAVALAEVGHRVLVVNTDRDNGSLHPALDAPGEPGLYDVLGGEALLEDVVRPGPSELVHVLPLGDAHLGAPSLMEMRFRGFLDDTEDAYDVVIAHAAPVSRSEDARIMAIHGALLLLVPSGSVHPRFVRRAADHLRSIRLRVLGSVLVGVRPSRRQLRTRAA